MIMSKGNMFNGYARGKVADVVFSRMKGQQITRAYNPMPANPKTEAQMLQRLKLASCTRFYKRGVNALFKYAFEDKKEKESEYNAFVRHNIANAILVTKDLYNVSGYPSFGLWQLTQGSLPVAQISVQEDNSILWTDAYGPINTEWGYVGDALKENVGLQDGDIVTAVLIKQNVFGTGGYINPPATTPTEAIMDNVISWQIKQAIIGKDTQYEVGELLGFGYSLTEGNLHLIPNITNESCAVALIYSRNTPNGLRVSDSYLLYINGWITVEMTSDEYIQECLQSYGYNPQAILQGSIANPQCTLSKGRSMKASAMVDTAKVSTKKSSTSVKAKAKAKADE